MFSLRIKPTTFKLKVSKLKLERLSLDRFYAIEDYAIKGQYFWKPQDKLKDFSSNLPRSTIYIHLNLVCFNNHTPFVSLFIYFRRNIWHKKRKWRSPSNQHRSNRMFLLVFLWLLSQMFCTKIRSKVFSHQQVSGLIIMNHGEGDFAHVLQQINVQCGRTSRRQTWDLRVCQWAVTIPKTI